MITAANGLEASPEELAEAERFQQVASMHDQEWTFEEAYRNWEMFSEDRDAGWLQMPKDDDALWGVWVLWTRR